MNNLFLLAQVQEAADEASAFVQSLPTIVIVLVVFAVLKFVIKASLFIVVIGSLLALVLSGIVTVNV